MARSIRPADAVDHGLEREGANGHLRQLGANQAEIADGLAEGDALLGVFRGDFEHAFGAADAGGAQGEAADVQNVEGHDVAAADFMQQIFLGHLAILEKDRRRGAAVQAHLFFFGARRKIRESRARR